MELEGADGFRISAYRKAAARIRETPASVAQLALDGKAKQLQDIGKTIEAKIVEVVEDGEILEQFPTVTREQVSAMMTAHEEQK